MSLYFLKLNLSDTIKLIPGSLIIGDIEIIERVQRRATKIPKSLWTMSYSERLEILGFTTLEERRTRGDLIQMYKIVKGLDVVEWEEEIEFRNIRRGHELSFNRESFKSSNRNDFANYVSIRHKFLQI